jgi:hypothetical protein
MAMKFPQIREKIKDEMGVVCSMYARSYKVYGFYPEKFIGRELVTTKRGWDNIIMDLKQYEDVNWICLVKDSPVIIDILCKYCNEPSGSVKDADIFEQLSDC